MAITKIHSGYIKSSIKYICDPSKTDGECLVTSFACSPETAEFDFGSALQAAGNRKNENLGYHLIQSFKPGEVTPEEAHRIGLELADRILEGKYSYVCATHQDKDHVHSHIVFCAADNIRHRKYNACKQSYYRIRQLSDEICAENGLSVIAGTKSKGRHYGEWKAGKEGSSWKEQEQTSDKTRRKKSPDRLIDTTAKRFTDNPYLKRWATLQNLKLMAGKYSEIGTLTDLAERLQIVSDQTKTKRETLAQMDKRIKKLELILFDGAREYLRENKAELKTIDPDVLAKEYEILKKSRQELSGQYRQYEVEKKKLEKDLSEMASFLGLNDSLEKRVPGIESDKQL